LREEKAIEARGSGGSESVQAVFDLGSGEFAGTSSAEPATERQPSEPAASADGAGGPTLSDDQREVLDAVSDLDVNETPPVELLAKVQQWQERLDDD
jgi:DNA mismatch repair protein MutS